VRATIDGIDVEGTPEELARFHAAIRSGRDDNAADTRREMQGISEAGTIESHGISEEFAYRVLRRLPLSKAQKSLLHTLKGAHPAWLLSSEIQSALACSPTSLGGIFGGLGRRVSATKGYNAGYNLWDWKWDEDEGEWAYRLPETVVSALDRAGQ